MNSVQSGGGGGGGIEDDIKVGGRIVPPSAQVGGLSLPQLDAGVGHQSD